MLKILLASFFLSSSLMGAIQESETSFKNAENHSIRGKFSYPDSDQKKLPGVLLIHGAGEYGMDMTFSSSLTTDDQPHPMFKVIAESLSEAGALVFRYNKRGVSHGKYGREIDEAISNTGTITNLVLDAEQAYRHLRSHPRVDKNRIFLLGISEGSIVAPQVALKNPEIHGLILLSSVGRDMADNLYYQFVGKWMNIMREKVDADRDGYITIKERRKFADLDRFQVDLIDRDRDRRLSLPEFEAHLVMKYYQLVEAINNLEGSEVWNDFMDKEDNYKYIGRFPGPLLLVHGAADTQTPLVELYLIEDHLKNIFKKNFTTKVYPNLGHGLSPHKGYDGLVQTIGPIEDYVLKDINSWLHQQLN